MTITVYGIKNCDTVKKACKWLDQNDVAYQFHDVRADGLTSANVSAWIQQLGWETIINKRSTTWKSLSPNMRDSMDSQSAVKAIVENPTLFKRPLLDKGGTFLTGFKDKDYEQFLNS